MLHNIRKAYKKYFNKWLYFKKQNTIYHLLFSYRYLSLLITSVFYFIGPPKSPIPFKMGVSVSLYIAAIIIMSLYMKYKKTNFLLEAIILTETLGIAILLLPTGGMDSPFIWYALNPVLIAACFSNLYFCWVNLIFYFGSFLLISQPMYIDALGTRPSVFMEYSYVFLIFILITLAVQLFGRLHNKLILQTEKVIEQSRDLEKMNGALRESNERVEESMNEIMSMYQVLEAFSSKESVEKLCKYFVKYAAKLTKSSYSFLLMKTEEDKERNMLMYGEGHSGKIEENLREEIDRYWEKNSNREEYFEIEVLEQKWTIRSVQTPAQHYGFIGVCVENDTYKKEFHRHLNFLSELLGIILERYRLNKVAENFMLVEEQNRIADEIHDNVSQRLFGITYGTHALINKLKEDLPAKTIGQLENIYESSKMAMKELRATIYSLSSKKDENAGFFNMVEKYLQQLSQLNDITIHVELKGKEDQLPSDVRKAIYRIISEATGNAIKHSQCNRIQVILLQDPSKTMVCIEDDGVGFNLENRMNKRGLGFQNMEHIVQSFHGVFNIDSNEGGGTKIYIELSTKHMNYVTQGGVA